MASVKYSNTLRYRVNGYRWFHEINLGEDELTPGIDQMTPGLASNADLTAQADLYFPSDLVRGKSVLDVGCWDGFNSFEAKRRGAERVVATDHYVWGEGPGAWGDVRSIRLAKQILNSDIEIMDIDVFDLTPENTGTFDVTLFAGVFYHLKHPFMAIEKVAALTTECMIVETHMDALDIDSPAMIFYPGEEVNEDPTNWWGPNPSCVTAMLRDCGFSRVDYTASPVGPSRGIFHAWR